jgi:hypothetical protein
VRDGLDQRLTWDALDRLVRVEDVDAVQNPVDFVYDGQGRRVGAIEHVETALYFSMVTFTTLGYGDITLPSDWRLLSSFEAANGIIMFGWSTAFVAAFIQRLAPEQHGGHRDS